MKKNKFVDNNTDYINDCRFSLEALKIWKVGMDNSIKELELEIEFIRGERALLYQKERIDVKLLRNCYNRLKSYSSIYNNVIELIGKKSKS